MPDVQGVDAALELKRGEDEFFKNQFTTLRKEIEDAKTRVFQAMGVGLIIVPGSQLLQGLKTIAFAPAVNLFLPLLVMVASLVYLSESSAIIRCGSYIREHIESRFQGAMGWEEWLENDPDHRRHRHLSGPGVSEPVRLLLPGVRLDRHGHGV